MNARCPPLLPVTEHPDGQLIARAMTTAGGHLFVGRGGYTLWYHCGCRLHGYDVEPDEGGLPRGRPAGHRQP